MSDVRPVELDYNHRPSPLAALAEWAAEGRRARLLESLALGPVQTEMFSWDYRFASDDGPWAVASSMGEFTGQADLDEAAQTEVRRALLDSLARYRDDDGRWVIPHACRLLWGRRAAS